MTEKSATALNPVFREMSVIPILGFGENFWDNYPSQYNNTIEPDDIKVLLGRIMQYGYQGNISTSWKSQNDADADKMAHAIALPSFSYGKPLSVSVMRILTM
jgi:hypothetical protein